MSPALQTTWLLDSTVNKNELVTILETDFRVEIDPSTTSDLTIYDDFDHHLWSADLTLGRLNKQIFQLFKGADCLAEARASAKTRFWWDFPEGEVRDRLKKKIDLRAVMPIAELNLVSTEFSLRNSDEKIVAKGQFLESSVDDDTWHYLTLTEMRGYKKSLSRARKLLKPSLQRKIPEFGVRTMLTNQTSSTSETNAVQVLQLAPDMPAELAVRAMGKEMLDQASRHVDGVVNDIDTVFLHQFRVSVRRLRTLMSLLKQSFPVSTVEAVSPKLSLIAGKTSRLRDLDVFLLEQNSYRAMLPESHEAGLNEIFALVARQRRQEKARLARYFLSSEFQQDIDDCKAELSASPDFQTPMSRKPVSSVAKSLLIKRYKKIRSMSARLNTNSVDEDVHDIRKEFKKLRYLIEFFIELLARKRTARLLAHLKRMQVTLGDFNDYCVQIEFLSGFSDDRKIEMTKALSGLIAVLHHKKITTRNQVEAALERFFEEERSTEIELAYGTKASGEAN